MAIFLGYSIGSAPIVGYHYGAENHREMKSLFRKSLLILSVTGVAMLILSQLLAHPLVNIFVGYDAGLMEITLRGFRIYSLMFLILGYNIWGSSFFTALGDGVISAAISFMRTLIFQLSSLILLPNLFKLDGVWASAVVAEVLALVLTVFFLIRNRDKYHYGR